MNIPSTENIKWSENIIIADADYIDRVAFDLIVNFERMLGRQIPKADFSQWATNIALDGGLRSGEHETQVVLLHDDSSRKLENFMPADYEQELNNQAFKDDNLGEFIINSIPTTEANTKEDVLCDLVQTLLTNKSIKRIMVIADGDESDIYDPLRSILRKADEDKHITLFAMQPITGGNFRQEILGYSLMNAMGIRGDELK